MRKRIMIALAAALLILCAGCGGSSGPFEAGAPEGLVGQWRCEALASDGETDTSFYEMRVEEDGSFSMFDFAAGNPGISGEMGNDSGKTVECRFDADDFDAPVCWNLKEPADTLDYECMGDTMMLGYGGVWMTFHRAADE